MKVHSFDVSKHAIVTSIFDKKICIHALSYHIFFCFPSSRYHVVQTEHVVHIRNGCGR